MTDKTTEALIKTLIETQVIEALNKAPEAIEKLVRAAISGPVDSVTGTHDGYRGTKIPYLEYMIGEEIRSATRGVVKKAIADLMPTIEAEVRKGLTSESVVAAVTRSLIATADQEWRIEVKFAAEKER